MNVEDCRGFDLLNKVKVALLLEGFWDTFVEGFVFMQKQKGYAFGIAFGTYQQYAHVGMSFCCRGILW